MTTHAPRTASWLLGWLLSDADKEALIGDLHEEYVLRAQADSRPNADRWYVSQVWRSLPRLVWRSFRGGEWRGALGAGFSVYVFVGFVEFFIQAAIFRIFALSPEMRWALSVPIGLPVMALGGFVAAWMRRGAAGALAFIVAGVIVIMMILMGDASPRWYQITFLILGPLAALTGGALRRRQQASSR